MVSFPYSYEMTVHVDAWELAHMLAHLVLLGGASEDLANRCLHDNQCLASVPAVV